MILLIKATSQYYFQIRMKQTDDTYLYPIYNSSTRIILKESLDMLLF